MKRILLTLIALFLATLTYAQSGINYKALITDNGNALNTQPVTIRFTVLANGTTSVYQETQVVTTDANGIISVQIGEGTQVSGDYNTIDFAIPQSLKVEIDSDGSGYIDFGTNALKYVPKAKYADQAGSVDYGNIINVPAGIADGDDDTHLTDTQIAAMGYIKNANDADNDPTNEIELPATATNGQVLTWNGAAWVAQNTGGNDNWGNQIAETNSSINGDGTISSPLGVNINDAAFNGWDKNASDDFDGDFMHLTNVPTGLADGDDNTQLTDAQIAAMGYIKSANDADNDTTNEIQTISKDASNVVTLTRGGGSFTDADTQLTETQVDAMVNNNGYAKKLNDLSDAKSDANDTSVFIGVDAGASDDDSDNMNVGIGRNALNYNVNGDGNVATGVSALQANISGNSNTANGMSALAANTTGNYNTALGSNALASSETGIENTVVGDFAGFDNVSGSGNIFLGNEAGYSETGSNKLYIDNSATTSPLIGGDFSTDEVTINGTLKVTGGTPGAGKVFTSDANGKGSWETPTAGGASQLNDLSDAKSDNDGSNDGSSIFIGVNAGLNDDSSDNHNVGIGFEVLKFNTTGNNSTAIGRQALYANTTGSNNIAIGSEALADNDSGNDNVATGNYALRFNSTGYNNTANGYSSLIYNTTGSYNTSIGHSALSDNTTGEGNTAIGTSALFHNKANKGSVAIGSGAMHYADDRTSGGYTHNTGVGFQALRGSSTPADNTGKHNTAVGSQSLYSITSGDYNTANGYQALYANTTGFNNTANGGYALKENINGVYNTANGHNALSSNTSGSVNTASGKAALRSNTTGQGNTAIGAGAGDSNQTGNYNVFIGYGAGDNETGSNKLYIDNSNTSTPLIYGDFENKYVKINGSLCGTDSGVADMKAHVYGYVYWGGAEPLINGGSSSAGCNLTYISTGNYKITFTGNNNSYTVIATANSDYPRFVNVKKDATNNCFYVKVYDLGGHLVDDEFYFVVYKPY